jgi:hypothetical protein
VGHLGLTDTEENQIVAFLQTLTDGFFVPSSKAPPVPSVKTPPRFQKKVASQP